LVRVRHERAREGCTAGPGQGPSASGIKAAPGGTSLGVRTLARTGMEGTRLAVTWLVISGGLRVGCGMISGGPQGRARWAT
jgi:hypothetical protein